MKRNKLTFLLTLFMGMMGINATAHDIAVPNSEGVTIYYSILDNMLSVTYSGSSPTWYTNEYSGSVVIPETVTYNGTTYSVTAIGNHAFSGCYSLTDVTIPNSIKSIGSGAFLNCSSLLNITIPNSVKGIGFETFSGCSCMTNAIIGDSVTNIGHDAFNGCSSLTEVIIGNSVTRIQSDAFYGCSSLTDVNIPNSVTSIETRAFENSGIYMNSSDGVFYVDNWACGYKGTMPSNEIIYLQGGTMGIADEAFSNYQNLQSIILPNSVITIGDGAFINCSGLMSATLSNSVNNIGSGAFRGCSGLTNLIIPNSVTSVGGYAFYGCSGLTSMTLGSLVTSIGSDAFSGCSGLTNLKIQVDDISSFCNNDVVGLIKTSFGKPVLLIDKDGNEIYELSVPADVTSIGDHAFQNCTGLVSVIMPNSVTSIGNYAFSGCYNLNNVVIPISVTCIGGPSSFHDCYYLTVKVPVTDYSAFCNNQIIYLIKHNIGVPIHLIDEKGNEIEEFVIPEGVTSIGEYAFYYCTGLTNVIIPNSVKNINGYAFEGCSNLTSVIIGDGIQTIQSMAFGNCQKLTDVYCYAEDVPTAHLNPFDGSNIECATLHVPKESLNAYTITEPWNKFGSIERIKMPEHTLIYMVDGNVYKTYQIEEGESILSEPYPSREGYTFSGWSDIPIIMPAHDVTVTGTFSINSYTLTYMIGDEVYKQVVYEYGATITPEPQPEGDYVSFEWVSVPETMPAHDVTVTAVYETGITEIMMMAQQGQVRIYSPNGKKLDKLQKGLNIVVMQAGTTRKVVVK